jgi:hypothetical protein
VLPGGDPGCPSLRLCSRHGGAIDLLVLQEGLQALFLRSGGAAAASMEVTASVVLMHLPLPALPPCQG